MSKNTDKLLRHIAWETDKEGKQYIRPFETAKKLNITYHTSLACANTLTKLGITDYKRDKDGGMYSLKKKYKDGMVYDFIYNYTSDLE